MFLAQKLQIINIRPCIQILFIFLNKKHIQCLEYKIYSTKKRSIQQTLDTNIVKDARQVYIKVKSKNLRFKQEVPIKVWDQSQRQKMRFWDQSQGPKNHVVGPIQHFLTSGIGSQNQKNCFLRDRMLSSNPISSPCGELMGPCCYLT